MHWRVLLKRCKTTKEKGIAIGSSLGIGFIVDAWFINLSNNKIMKQ